MTIKATIGALLLAGTALCAPATWAQEVQRGGTLNFTAEPMLSRPLGAWLLVHRTVPRLSARYA